ncbi:MAG: SHOCT domain-containing protein, partial [Haloechinothrix sp.]
MMMWMVLWGVVGLALIGLSIAGIVWVVRRGDSHQRPNPSAESPEDVLKRRYAAGEIDEDEFLRRRAGLD